MSTQEIRFHLGSFALRFLSERDWPEGMIQTGHRESEPWIYEDGKPVRMATPEEVQSILNPNRPSSCPTS